MHRTLSPLLLAAFLLAPPLFIGCEPHTQTSPAQKSASSPEANKQDEPAEDAWRATLLEVEGAGPVEWRAFEGESWRALTEGVEMTPGASVRTSEATRARLELSGGNGGEVALNRESELELLRSRPGVEVRRGHAIVTTPRLEAQGRAPTIKTPTGEVTLLGTRVSVSAGSERSTVAVSQGQASASRDGAPALTASFGQELVLERAEAPRVVEAPQMARAFEWREFHDQEAPIAQVERGMGKLVARPPNSESERPLELRRHEIKVTIQGMLAYTEITEVFHNPSGERLEGMYRFPLPEDAQISRLALKVGDRIMEGQFLETARAERIWREVTVVQRKDPALLQWKQGNQFELRIFPIEPHSSRQVTIGYVQRLKPTAEGYRYVYPMPVDRTGQTHTARFDFEAEIIGHASTEAVRVGGYSGATLTPQVSQEEDVARTQIKLERTSFRPAGDLTVDFALVPSSREVAVHAFRDSGRPKEDRFVAVTLRPEFERGEQVEARDFVIVVDRSYGAQGAALELYKQLTERLLGEIDPLDRVRLLACNHACVALGSKAFERRAWRASSSLSRCSATWPRTRATSPRAPSILSRTPNRALRSAAKT